MCYGDPYHNTDGEYLRYLENMQQQEERSALEATLYHLDMIVSDFWYDVLTEEQARIEIKNILGSDEEFEGICLLFVERI